MSRKYGRRPSMRGQVGLPAPGHQGEVLARRRAHVGGVAGVPEVGVAVDEDQPDPAADRLAEPVHGQRRAEQDRAVSAQHQRELAPVDDGADPLGERQRVVGDLPGVAHPVAGAPVARVVPGRGEAAGVAGPQPGEQVVVTQRPGRLAAAGDRRGRRRPQTEICRRVEDGDPAHHELPSSVVGRAGRNAGPRWRATNSEQGAGQGPARRGDRRIVRAGDGEQRDQVLADLLPVLAGGPADQARPAGRTPARPGR